MAGFEIAFVLLGVFEIGCTRSANLKGSIAYTRLIVLVPRLSGFFIGEIYEQAYSRAVEC